MPSSTKWRVDRTQGECPVGMNSIRCLSGSERVARKEYDKLAAGLDAWNQPDLSYGVLLSCWDGTDYKRVSFKLLPMEKNP